MNKNKKTIVVVANYYPPHVGGLEIVAQQQAQSFVKAGNSVSVITCAAGGAMPGIADEDGIAVHRVPAINYFDERFHIPFTIGGFTMFSHLRREISRADAVYIHDVFYMPSWLAYLVARIYKKPVYLTQHVAVVKHPNAFVTAVQRTVYATWGTWIFNYSKQIIVYNDNVRSFLIERGVDFRKIREIRNGIDLKKFRPGTREEKLAARQRFGLPLEKPLALFVGRFVPKKGFTALLEATDPAYDIVFAGSSESGRQLPSKEGVHIVGPQNQDAIAELYRAADLFVLPAQGEVFTLAMQEAMATGLPVLIAHEPGYRKYDIDRILIAFADPTPEDLKKKLKELFTDSALLKKMGIYSLSLAEKWFNWETNMQAVITMHEEGGEEKEVPKTIVTTSWDDGHTLDLKLADLLKKYGLAGTFYISPEDREIAPKQRLSDAQIKALGKDFEIGAHTLTHPRLSEVPNTEARQEIITSKKALEAMLGHEVKSFCYPGGDYRPVHEKIVKEAGFSLGRTVERFCTDIGDDPFAMPTTFHAYRHWSDVLPIFNKAGFSRFIDYYLHWDTLAIAIFDETLKKGGIFHLWGHSWEIDNHNDWARLERVFAHIGKRKNIEYRTNGQLLS